MEAHFMAHGTSLKQVVESARSVEYQIPFLENLVSEGMWTSLGDGQVGIGLPSGEHKLIMTGDGVFTGKLYIHTAEVSQQHLDNMVKSQSISDLRTAIERSVDAVDQYLTYRAELWNAAHPEQHLAESGDLKVSTQDKVSRWIPKMLNGRRLNSERAWQAFLALKRLRDDFIVHPKSALLGLTFEEMAARANDVRTGPARLLLDLHILYGEPAPAAIIKAAYRPDFIVEKA